MCQIHFEWKWYGLVWLVWSKRREREKTSNLLCVLMLSLQPACIKNETKQMNRLYHVKKEREREQIDSSWTKSMHMNINIEHNGSIF